MALQSKDHFKAGRIAESGAIGRISLHRVGAVRNQSIQRQGPVADQAPHGFQVVRLPLRGDPQPRLPHERHWKRKRQPLGIEAGQNNLAARRDPPDQRVQQS